MRHNFHVEPAGTPYGTPGTKSIKVYAEDNKDLPVKIEHKKRFAIFYAGTEGFFEKFHNFVVRKDDIWVITMPKCGTTWMLELVWLLANGLDYDTAMKVEQEVRCPFFEFCAMIPAAAPYSLEQIEECKSPRIIKSHLAMHMLPKGLWTVKPKIIYVAREPKDAAISYYHFMTSTGRNFFGKEEFLKIVLKNEMFFNPFWNHVVEFWELRNELNVYFTSFERMKNNLKEIVFQVGEFLQKPVEHGDMDKLVHHLAFENMKNNSMCNHAKLVQMIKKSADAANNNNFNFIRQGNVGSHKEDMSENIITKFDEWTSKELEPFGVSSKEILYSKIYYK